MADELSNREKRQMGTDVQINVQPVPPSRDAVDAARRENGGILRETRVGDAQEGTTTPPRQPKQEQPLQSSLRGDARVEPPVQKKKVGRPASDRTAQITVRIHPQLSNRIKGDIEEDGSLTTTDVIEKALLNYYRLQRRDLNKPS